MGMIMKDDIPYGGIYPIDDAPTQGSNNAVKSGGVFSSLSNKVDKVAGKGLSTNDYSDTEKGKVTANTEAIEAMVNVYSGKNLAPNNATTQTINTLPIVINKDKSIFCQGTNDGALIIFKLSEFKLKQGTYILSDGGYSYQFGGHVFIHLGETTNTQPMIAHTNTPTGEMEFTVDSIIESWTLKLELVIDSQITLDGTFYPMIRDARITDPTYVPYAMTNRELTDVVTTHPIASDGVGDLNDAITNGIYHYYGSSLNTPSGSRDGSLLVIAYSDENGTLITQLATSSTGLYKRRWFSGMGWTEWVPYAIEKGSVSVTSQTDETWASLLSRLNAIVDWGKVSHKSCIDLYVNHQHYVYMMWSYDNRGGTQVFYSNEFSPNREPIMTRIIMYSQNTIEQIVGSTYQNVSSNTLPGGAILSLHY